MNKGQLVTRGIKHWGLGGYSSFLPRIKFGVTGQESSPQSPTISYRHPLEKSEVKQVITKPMGTGNKSTRIVAWTFLSEKEQKEWAKTRWRGAEL
ncbi:MAG TPA: hypothetical protein VFC87_03590 [Perlabentimonas sp.]|nr:hypothetical protein [Perlabentimonas sp.]